MSTTKDKPARSGNSVFQKIRKVLRVLVSIFGGCKQGTDKKGGVTPASGQGNSANP